MIDSASMEIIYILCIAVVSHMHVSALTNVMSCFSLPICTLQQDNVFLRKLEQDRVTRKRTMTLELWIPFRLLSVSSMTLVSRKETSVVELD